MKRCPQCQSTYTDDTLRFCLQDGTPLVSASSSSSSGGGTRGPSSSDAEKTLVMDSSELPRGDEPPPTEILPPAVLPTVPSSKPQATTPQQARPTGIGAQNFTAPHAPAELRGKNTAFVIPVTIAATVLVLALVGLGAWLLFGNRDGRVTGNTRVDGERTARTPAPAASPTVSPATASPTPASSPVDVASVKREVTGVLNAWAQSSMARDLDAQMSYYADRLDTYYTKSNVSAQAVRADRERAYNTYSSLDISLSNIEVTPDSTGERAAAIFDKTWNFEGEEKSTSGSVQQKLWLAKTGGRWRITGEKDLQVYYVNK